MPEELHTKTQKLIRDIELKDKRFRVAQSVFTILILLVLIGVITAQYRTLNGVQDQLDQQKSIAAAADSRDKEQQETILRRLDCMTVFFSQVDRTKLSIENIDKCTLNRDGNLQQFFTQEPGEAPQTTREEQPPEESSNLAPSTPSDQDESAEPNPPEVIEETRNVLQRLLDMVRGLLP